jgi:signal transduction histidine kinase
MRSLRIAEFIRNSDFTISWVYRMDQLTFRAKYRLSRDIDGSASFQRLRQGDLGIVAGFGDHGATVGVVDQDDRAVRKNGISVVMELGQELPRLTGDRIQLQQVMLNLINNAVQAMSVAGVEPRELVIFTSKADRDGIVVAVRDSGPGLDPASPERVFDAFYTTKPDGLGIGLSVCRSIIEAHGGRLWASPNTPRGATFQFTVPA